MEELEDPTESLHEHIHEGAHHAEVEGKNKWIIYVALTTAIIAVFSAITSLIAAHHADESMLSQIHASDQWAYYQAKSIKLTVVTHAATPDSAAAARLSNDAAAIQSQAKETGCLLIPVVSILLELKVVNNNLDPHEFTIGNFKKNQ